MNKKYFALLAILSVFSLSMNVAHAGNSSTGTIDSINAAGVVQVRGTMSGGFSCPDTDAYILEADNENFKNLYAALLTAYAAGTSLRFNVQACTVGSKQRPVINSVFLQ